MLEPRDGFDASKEWESSIAGVHVSAIINWFGVNPEEQAWGKMLAWAKPRGLLDNIADHPLFGFNNPYPMEVGGRYGYEFWIEVGPDAEPEGEIRIGEFMGGTYAVARYEVRGRPATIPEGWRELAHWCKTNNHALGSHHALERFLSTPDDLDALVLELCCPITS